MTTIFLTRHGQSEANAQLRLIGQRDDPALTDLGRAQASRLGVRLKEMGVDQVVCSPAARAHETAAMLVTIIGGGIPLKRELDLRERNFGPFEGLTRVELDVRRSDIGLSNDDPTGFFPACVKGVESAEDVLARAHRVLLELAADSGTKTTAIVTHAGVIRGLIYGLLGIPEHVPRAFKIREASFIKLNLQATFAEIEEVWPNNQEVTIGGGINASSKST